MNCEADVSKTYEKLSEKQKPMNNYLSLGRGKYSPSPPHTHTTPSPLPFLRMCYHTHSESRRAHARKPPAAAESRPAGEPAGRCASRPRRELGDTRGGEGGGAAGTTAGVNCGGARANRRPPEGARVGVAGHLPVGGAVVVVLGEGVGPGVAARDVEERHEGRVEGREVLRRRRPEEGHPHHRRCPRPPPPPRRRHRPGRQLPSRRACPDSHMASPNERARTRTRPFRPGIGGQSCPVALRPPQNAFLPNENAGAPSGRLFCALGRVRLPPFPRTGQTQTFDPVGQMSRHPAPQNRRARTRGRKAGPTQYSPGPPIASTPTPTRRRGQGCSPPLNRTAPTCLFEPLRPQAGLRPRGTDADEEEEDDEDVDDGDDGEGEGRDDLAEGLEAAEEADDAEGAEDADEAGGLVGHDDGEEGHDDDEGVQPRPAAPRARSLRPKPVHPLQGC